MSAKSDHPIRRVLGAWSLLWVASMSSACPGCPGDEGSDGSGTGGDQDMPDDTGGHEAKAFELDADYSPYVGDFDADGCHDIAWFDAVGDMLHVWRCLPDSRDFDCGVPASTPPNAAPVGMHWGF